MKRIESKNVPYDLGDPIGFEGDFYNGKAYYLDENGKIYMKVKKTKNCVTSETYYEFCDDEDFDQLPEITKKWIQKYLGI